MVSGQGEATALTKGPAPQRHRCEDRNIQLWGARDLSFTDEAMGSLRVVLAEEQWREVQRVGGRKEIRDQHRSWRWLVSQELDPSVAQVIWQIGPQRWGIENHAFNELTQHGHLEHCPHHHPVTIIGWRLILVLACNVFAWFSRLHGELWRLGHTTLQEIARQLFLALACWEELQPLWSG